MEMPQVPPLIFQEGPLKSRCGFKTSRCAEWRGEESYNTALPNDALILQNHPPCASSSLKENIYYREENSKTFEELLALTSGETKK